MDKILGLSVVICYKFVRNHFLLTTAIFFLTFLYRMFPLLFFIFVQASPVLVATAVLLGFLLSYGEITVQETVVKSEKDYVKSGEEIEEAEVKSEEDCVKSGGEMDVERARIHKVPPKFALETCDSVSSVHDDNNLQYVNSDTDYVGEPVKQDNILDGDMEDYLPLLSENSGEGQNSNWKSNFRQPMLSSDKGDHSAGPFHAFDSNRVKEGEEEEEDEEENVVDDSNSESPIAPNASRDTSVRIVISARDELQPLLDVESAHQMSDHSEMLSANSAYSSSGTEDLIMEQDDSDEDDNEHGEEATEEGKEDGSNSAIKWTEDDEKCLMDLGHLELERNQRLENLILRRRARVNARLMAERNLIDLDAYDPSFSITSISTRRQNPFDLPYDLVDDVPGSAPSVLLPRNYPFDIPFDSSQKDPEIGSDKGHVPSNHKEAVFSRHESFHVGTSYSGFSRHEMHDLPYFIPGQFSVEGTSALEWELNEDNVSNLSSKLKVDNNDNQQCMSDNVHHEVEGMPDDDCSSLLVKHGSITSEDVDTDDIKDNTEKEHLEIDKTEIDSTSSNSVFLGPGEIILKMEHDTEQSSNTSIASAISDSEETESTGNEELTNTSEDRSQKSVSFCEESLRQEEAYSSVGDGQLDSTNASQQDSSEVDQHELKENSADLDHANETITDDGSHHKDPVYDSSPSSTTLHLPFGSSSSGTVDESIKMSSRTSLPEHSTTGKTEAQLGGKENYCVAVTNAEAGVNQNELMNGIEAQKLEEPR